jgi:formate dehydrogenase iron-sulfur subunit
MRPALLAEAHRRIEENPDGYLPHVFGEKEVGGTSVLMLSAVPYELFGYKASYTDKALPDHTWAILQHVPDIASLGFVLLGGIWWITNRRDEVASSEAEERLGKPNSSIEGAKKEGGES